MPNVTVLATLVSSFVQRVHLELILESLVVGGILQADEKVN